MTKVLVCSEFSQVGSGYAAYTKELLEGFRNKGIEVAELASFCRPEDPRIQACNWRVYPVLPAQNDKAAIERFQASGENPFGKHIFEDVLLDYQPTHVIDVRDVWTFVHEFTSPYRNFYSHLIMPAVDSDPQFKTWLELYSKADAVVTYCDWATKLLKHYGLKNVYGSVSPVPPVSYQPLKDREKLRNSLGLGDNINIIGTVMRNQHRKLYPNLFKMFRKLLDTEDKNYYLYCHTSYPDIWQLDELLLEHNVSHRVLFTYHCMYCDFVETSFYKGPTAYCPRCGNNERTLKLPSTSFPIHRNVLNQIYNLFDLYIQYAALEGYGIPVAEAISAGIPTMSVNYSGMKTFINEGKSIPIEPKVYHIEPETMRRFAIPDDDDAISKISKFFNETSKQREMHSKLARVMYGTRNFNDCIDTWIHAINSTKPKEPWNASRKHYAQPTEPPPHMNNVLFARWLILNILQDQSYVGSYMEARLIRDLDNGFTTLAHDGQYYYEAMGILGTTHRGFNRETAFNHFLTLLQQKIEYEDKRVRRLGL